ncbi:MAG: amino acid ABC transporter permease [Anaerolinea sp.]|nr:amino acid ABC transporter permease [Anaerolinea sp.]
MQITTDARTAPRFYKRNLLIRRVSRAPWWLLGAAVLILAFVVGAAQDDVYRRVWEQVQQGIGTTLGVTVIAYSTAIVLGLIIALLRRSQNALIYQAVTFYVEVVRGIPTLVLVYYVVLAVTPEAVRLGNELGAWMQENGILPFIAQPIAELRTRDVSNAARAIVGLAISYSAFLSEIFRAGIDSIEAGQREAGLSLGMTRWQIMRSIILPQAFRNVLPPLANDFIAMLKESSLVSIVGVNDITRQGATFASANFLFFQSYNVVALTYLVLTLTLAIAVKTLESYLDRGKKRGG